MTIMVTATDLGMRSHSYRNFNPMEFLDARDASGRREALDALNRVEGGRFEPFLANVSDFFTKLDRDERHDFARRNPGVVLWMTVWNELNGYNPYRFWREFAQGHLEDNAAIDPPPYQRKEREEGESALQDMAFRRRSYRNWTPQEVGAVTEQEFDLGKGMVRELGMFDVDVRDDLDYPVEVSGRHVARAVLRRIEAGRFDPVMDQGHTFFAPLDPDERRLFARRNPGLVMWISVWGRANHLIHGDQMFPHSPGIYPTLEEVK